MKKTTYFSKTYLLILLFFVSFFGFSQNKQKTQETWNLLLANKRKEARESFEKHLRKDIDKNIEILLLDAYIDVENGRTIFDESFLEKFSKFEESPSYLYSIWYQSFAIGNLSDTGYDDNTYKKIDFLANHPKFKNDLLVLYSKYTADKRRRKYTENKNQLKAINAIDTWQLCGVFENLNDSGLEMEYEAEIYPKNDKLFDAASNGQVNWYNPIDKQAEGGYHFYYNEPEYGAGIMYAQTFIDSDKEQEVYLNFGASSSLKLFLNDVEIYVNNLISKTDLNAFRIAVTLNQGTNRLLVKSSIGNGSDYFFVSVSDKNYNVIPNLTYQDTFKNYNKSTLEKIKPRVEKSHFENYLEDLVQKNPNNVLYNIMLFNAYLGNRKTEQAEDVIDFLYEKYPESSWIRYHLATFYAYKGESQKSNEILKNIELTDKNYYNNISLLIENNALLSSKSIKELETYKEDSKKLISQQWSLLFDMFIVARNSDANEMISILEKLLEETANNEILISHYASLFISAKNDTEKTIQILEEFNAKIEDQGIISDLIYYYDQTRQKDKRIALLKERVTLYPYSNSMTQGYILYLDEEKKYQEIIDLTANNLKNFPYSFSALEQQGQAYNKMKNVKQAENLFRQSLSHNSGNTKLRKQLYDIIKKKDESEDLVTKDIYNWIKNKRGSSMKSDYGVVVLLDECIVNVYPEGGRKSDVTYIYEITSDTGIENLKEYNLSSYGNTILKSEIVKPDGSIVPAEKNYGGLVFTNLKVGDVIYVNYQSFQNSSGRFYKDFMLSYSLNSYYPTEELKYGIIYPKNISFDTKILNGEVPHTTKKIGDMNYMEWKKTKVPAISIYENYAPVFSDIANVLYIGTIKSWSDIANWYADLVQKNLKLDKVTTDAYNSIFPSGTTNLSETEIAKKIYTYIQDNITYSFLDFRQSGYVPQKPSKTITTKLGDCKDLSTLFVTLANKAGLKSNLVLVLTNNNGTLSNQLPNIGFNHCIIRVELEGKEHFMELTDNYAPFNTMPVNLYKANALVISFDKAVNAKAHLIQIPFDNTIMNAIDQTSIVNIKDDQKTISNTFTIQGQTKSYYNYSFSDATSEDVRIKDLERIYNDGLGKVVKLHKANLIKNDRYEKEISFSSDLTVTDKLQSLGSIKLTTIPYFNKAYTRDIILEENRDYSIFYTYYETVQKYTSDITINIDEGKKFIEIPENIALSYKQHSFSLVYELIKPNVLKVIRTINTPYDDISTKEYSEYKIYIDKAIQAEDQVIGFK